MKKKILLTAIGLLMLLQVAVAQSLIKGRIVETDGDAIIGATVKVKGTSRATSTDNNGGFSINANDGDDLVITSVGYKNVTVAAANGMVVNLVKDNKNINEVVVTALGVKKQRRSLGSSVSEVKGDLIQKSGEQNVIQALTGKASGVQVISSAGTPGASSKILLRGNSTFTGSNEPLFVVDGVPIDNSTSQPIPGDYPFNVNLSGVNESNRGLDINPNDIETVTILKGPAAASLYGQRGGNGAIVITTKRGKKGKGLGITYSTSLELSKVNKLPKLQSKYAQGAGGDYITYDPGDDGIVNTSDDVLGTPNNWGPRFDTSATLKPFDNYNTFFRNGMAVNHNVTIDGGSDNSSFRIGVGHLNNSGMIPNSSLKRTTISLTGENILSSWLKVGAYCNYSNTQGKRVQNGSTLGGAMLTLLRTPASFDITNYYDEDKKQPNLYYSIYDNPLFTINRNPYLDATNRILGNVYANITINKNLGFSLKTGLDNYNTNATQIFDLLSFGNDNQDGFGQINRSATGYTQLYTDVTLKYNQTFKEKFELSTLLGYNNWDEKNTFSFMRGRNIVLPDLYNFNNTSELYTSNTNSNSGSDAVFADVNLGYENTYFLNFTGRQEWSTTFGKGNKGFFYPKVEASYVFSEHLKNKLPVLNYGKIRGAIAKAGISPSAYSDRNYYTAPFFTDGFTNGNSFPYNGVTGFGVSNIFNPGNLKPEIVTGREVGLDLRFLNNRIIFEATYYNQVTDNILLIKPGAPTTGYQYVYQNSGRLQNRGLELMLDLNIIKNKNFSWNLTTNFTRNRSKVLALANGVKELAIESGFSGIGAYAIVDEPYGVFYGTKWERDSTSGQILIDENGYPKVSPINGRIGNPNPDWLMGINNSFTYKNLNFGFLLDIRQGGDVWNGTYARLNRIGRTEESADRERTYLVEGVFAPGTPKAGEKNDIEISAQSYYSRVVGDANGTSATENSVQDGSWVRLRSLNVGYRFDLTKHKIIARSLDISFTGRNLWLQTKYKGVDPETSLTGAGSNITGFDYFNNPGSKSFIFSAKIGF